MFRQPESYKQAQASTQLNDIQEFVFTRTLLFINVFDMLSRIILVILNIPWSLQYSVMVFYTYTYFFVSREPKIQF